MEGTATSRGSSIERSFLIAPETCLNLNIAVEQQLRSGVGAGRVRYGIWIRRICGQSGAGTRRGWYRVLRRRRPAEARRGRVAYRFPQGWIVLGPISARGQEGGLGGFDSQLRGTILEQEILIDRPGDVGQQASPFIVWHAEHPS